MFFCPFSIAITSLGEKRANLSAFRTFVRFVLVWICWFPVPLGAWEGLRFVIVALPGLFSYLFFMHKQSVFLPWCNFPNMTDICKRSCRHMKSVMIWLYGKIIILIKGI